MGLTGRYDFKGIQKVVIAAINAALAGTTWGASLLGSVWFKVFSPVENLLVGSAINYLTNKGLIVLNLADIMVEGAIDQSALDRAINDGLGRVSKGGLTPEEGKAIDDRVRKAADEDISFGAVPPDNGVPDVSDQGF